MLSALAVALVFQVQAGFEAGRYEFEERYRSLDVAWKRCLDRPRRLLAAPEIVAGMSAADAGNFSEASLHLDLAACKLDGSEIAPGDALSLRFRPAMIEPGTKATLIVSWAYKPEEVRPVNLEVAGRRVSVVPGRSLTLQFDPAATNPDLRINPEAGYLMPSTIDGSPRGTFLSIIKGGKDRVAWLKNASNPLSRALGRRITQVLAEPEREWFGPPVIDWLFTGERIEDGNLTVGNLDDVPFVDHQGSTFRVSIPQALRSKGAERKSAVVVVGFAPMDGLESRWFHSYGQGVVVKGCLNRGWVFVGVRSGASAVPAALDWLAATRGIDAKATFTIGFGKGASRALAAAREARRPSSVALINPRLSADDPPLAGAPIFLAYGKLDPSATDAYAQQMADLESRGRITLHEAAACEGEWALAESAAAMLAFFSHQAAGQPRAAARTGSSG